MIEKLNKTKLSLIFFNKRIKISKDKFIELMIPLISLIFLGFIMNYCKYGFDFTDEGYYMNSISNPFLYKYTLSQFGFIYYPVYKLLGGNIILLREVNLIVTYLLGGCLFYNTISCFSRKNQLTKIQIISLSIGFGFATITNNYGLLTPSYNSLVLQGILIASISLVKLSFTNEKNILYLFLLCFGGWLTFMAKPPSAILLAIASSLFLIVFKKMSIKNLSIIIGISFLLILMGAYIIDSSLQTFIFRLTKAKELISYQGSDHTWRSIIRFDRLELPVKQWNYIYFFSGLIYLNSIWFRSKKIYIFILANILSMTALVYSFKALLKGFPYITELFDFLGGYFFSIVIFSIVILIYDIFHNKKRISIKSIFAILIMLSMPYIYSFSTNNNYWGQGVNASIFYIICSVILILIGNKEKTYYRMVSICLASFLVSSIIISNAMYLPYRQPEDLLKNNYSGNFGGLGDELLLSRGFGEYIENALYLSEKSGFKKDFPVIDLSGQSPGLLYAMRAKSIGDAWLIGGLSISERATVAKFEIVSPAIMKDAWLLIEPDGPRSIDIGILNQIGIDLTKYEAVSSWNTPEYAGGYKESRKQILMKPKEIDK